MIACATTSAWINFGFALAGILVGGLVAHYFTKDRDAAARKTLLDREADVRRRQFRKFLHTFRGRIERVDHGSDSAVWAEYARIAPEFKGEAFMVCSDFKEPDTFASLADTVGGWPYNIAEKRAKQEKTNIRQVLCDSIDRLIEFTNK